MNIYHLELLYFVAKHGGIAFCALLFRKKIR